MPRLPIPEADLDNWGALLNEFLRVAHRENGMLRGTYQVINVRDFGAIGDGGTSDTAALQEAIDNSGTGGGVVFLPPGTYLLTGALSIPSNVELRGAGPGRTILKVAANTPIDIILNKDFVKGNTNITISDLELDGNKSSNPRKPLEPWQPVLAGIRAQAGIHWTNVSHSRIINCFIHDCPWNGIVMSGSNDNEIISCQSNNNGNVQVRAHPIPGLPAWGQFEAFGILIWEEHPGMASERNRILACTTSGNEKHGIELLGAFHKDNIIMGCTATNNNGYGIILNSEGAIHAANIVDCTCLDNAEAGIGAFGDAANIEGNFLSRNGHGHFRGYLDTPAPVNGAGINISGNLCTISNNHVLDAITDVIDGAVQGITVSGDRNSIIGNIISKTQQRGILFGGKCNIVTGNTILYAGNIESTIGIGIQGNYSTNAIVSENTVQFSSFDGVYFAGVGGMNRISGNQINDNGGNGISIIEQSDCIIGENVCLSNGTKRITNNTYGILIHTSLRNIINCNRCGNHDINKTQDLGVAMVGPSDQAIITGNILSGNNVHSIEISGVANIIQLNIQDN